MKMHKTCEHFCKSCNPAHCHTCQNYSMKSAEQLKREKLEKRWNNKFGKLLKELRKLGYQCLDQKVTHYNVFEGKEIEEGFYWICRKLGNVYKIPTVKTYLERA